MRSTHGSAARQTPRQTRAGTRSASRSASRSSMGNDEVAGRSGERASPSPLGATEWQSLRRCLFGTMAGHREEHIVGVGSVDPQALNLAPPVVEFVEHLSERPNVTLVRHEKRELLFIWS